MFSGSDSDGIVEWRSRIVELRPYIAVWKSAGDPDQIKRWLRSIFPMKYLYTGLIKPCYNGLNAFRAGVRPPRHGWGKPRANETSYRSMQSVQVLFSYRLVVTLCTLDKPSHLFLPRATLVECTHFVHGAHSRLLIGVRHLRRLTALPVR